MCVSLSRRTDHDKREEEVTVKGKGERGQRGGGKNGERLFIFLGFSSRFFEPPTSILFMPTVSVPLHLLQ